jgi:hypothetical protein
MTAACMGRFARARGTSLFARAFNHDLPRRMATFSHQFPKSLNICLAEKPLTGFAEQLQSALTMSLPLVVECGEESVSTEDGEEGVSTYNISIQSVLTTWLDSLIKMRHEQPTKVRLDVF